MKQDKRNDAIPLAMKQNKHYEASLLAMKHCQLPF